MNAIAPQRLTFHAPDSGINDEARGARWSDQEVEWLRRNYEKLSVWACADYLGRTEMAVRLKIHRLRATVKRETQVTGQYEKVVLDQGVETGRGAGQGGETPDRHAKK